MGDGAVVCGGDEGESGCALSGGQSVHSGMAFMMCGMNAGRIGSTKDGMDVTSGVGMGFGQEAIPRMLDRVLGNISYVCLISVVLGEDASRQWVPGRNRQHQLGTLFFAGTRRSTGYRAPFASIHPGISRDVGKDNQILATPEDMMIPFTSRSTAVGRLVDNGCPTGWRSLPANLLVAFIVHALTRRRRTPKDPFSMHRDP